MNSNEMIQVEDLCKRYRIGESQPYRRFSELLIQASTAPLRMLKSSSETAPEREFVWALREVAFSVGRGEVVGVIGRNGAGKSTLLKVLSKITEPTEGRARVRGRVGSLLEIGTGFHPELTGRENVFLNGAILGMTRSEIRTKYDEIVEFSGIEQFLDTPVKRYSSGMYMRLAFAVSAHLNPSILIIDEVLAVGDMEFQNKCLGKLDEAAQGGRTVLFVSHNMGAISRLCRRVLVIEKGRLTFDGDVQEGIGRYVGSAKGMASRVDLSEASRWDDRGPRILTWISAHHEDGTESVVFQTGNKIRFRLGFKTTEGITARFQINIVDSAGNRLMTLRSTDSGPATRIAGKGVIECTLDDIRMMPGTYAVSAEIDQMIPEISCLDHIMEAMRIRVEIGDYLPHDTTGGVIAQQSHWCTDGERSA